VTRRSMVLAVLVSASLVACGGGGGGSAPSPATCSPSGTRLQITAANFVFDTDCLAAPEHQPFTIEFANDDNGTPHNVSILTSSGSTLFKGDITTGRKTITYQVNALRPGTYEFRCDVHPDTMKGTFIVK
jgi:plastocyanin